MRFSRLLTLSAVLAFATLAPSHAIAAPAATIGGIDCAAGGAVATLVNTSGGPMRFTLLRDDVAVATAVVTAAAGPVRRIVPVAEGAAAQVTIRYGSGYTSAYVQNSCAASGTTAGTTVEPALESAPFEAAPVAAAAASRPAATPGPAVPDAGADVTLAEEPATWPYTLAAIVALLLAVLLSGGRLRNRLRRSAARRAPAARQRG